MNLKKIDDTWHTFSKSQNVTLKHKERQQSNITQSHYLINFTNSTATFSFIGILWKSSDEKNTDKTSIIVEFENRPPIADFELETSSKLKRLFSKNKTTAFEKTVFKHLKKCNAQKITLKGNFIRIDTNHIFSNVKEFEQVINFMSKIKMTTA